MNYQLEIDIADLPKNTFGIISDNIPEDSSGEIIFEFEYEPAEEDNHSGHPDTWTPSYGSEVNITRSLHEDKDIMGNLFSNELYIIESEMSSRLEQKLLDSVSDY